MKLKRIAIWTLSALAFLVFAPVACFLGVNRYTAFETKQLYIEAGKLSPTTLFASLPKGTTVTFDRCGTASSRGFTLESGRTVKTAEEFLQAIVDAQAHDPTACRHFFFTVMPIAPFRGTFEGTLNDQGRITLGKSPYFFD